MRIIFFLLTVVSLSCNERKETLGLGTYTPIQTEARLDNIPDDSIIAPVSILINESKLKKVNAGNAAVTKFDNSIQTITGYKTIPVGRPSIITPGTDTFSNPITFAVIEKPVPVGMPETIVARDMNYKNSNPFSISSYGKLQGLKHNIISCLLQDRFGNLWFCSAAGVIRYDGRSFSNFTVKQGLVDDDVRSVLQDKSGNIWFGTLGGGVTKYDGRSFSNFTTNEGLCNNNVISMAEDDMGNIWFATWGGVTKYDGKTFSNYTEKQGLIDDFVQAVVKDRLGNLWFGTDKGVSKYDGKSFINYTSAEGLSDNDVYSLLADKEGRIWFGTASGVSIYDGSSFTNFNSASGLIHNEIFAMYQDSKDDIWLGTHYGISKYNGKSFTNLTENHGLSNDNIYCFLEDKSGNLWIGTAGGGVSKFTLNSFSHIIESEGLKKNYIFSIFEDNQENLWIGTWRGGVSVIKGNYMQHFTVQQGLPDNDIRSICQDRLGNYWFATSKGIAKYSGNIFTCYTTKDGLINNDVHSITEDRKGNLWFGTSSGASKYNGRSFTNFSKREGFVNEIVNCITEDKSGNIWFGVSGGVFKYNGYSFSRLVDGKGPLNISVNSITEDKSGTFWIGTERGLLKYDGRFITEFTQRGGLINNSVVSTLEDNAGNLWFGTRFGLSELSTEKSALLTQRLLAGALYDKDVYFKNYSHEDNFLGIGCYNGAMLQRKNNQVWVGTNGGVTYFNPDEIIKDTIAPNIQITSVKIENENIDWVKLKQNKDTSLLLNHGVVFSDFRFYDVSKWYHLPEQLSLAYYNNSISFDFIGITMNQPQNVKYQYKLEGLDKKEGKITTQNSASYGNLPKGTYTFRVKAMNSEGIWSNEFKFTFTIRPPWWQTWWFRIIAIAGTLFLIFFISRFIYSYYLSKQRIILEKQLAVQYERQRISSDLHDEIGSTLSSLNIYAGLAKKDPANKLYLDFINKNVNEAVNKLDDLVWSIKPSDDTLDSIAGRLISYAEPVLRLKNIDFKLDVGSNLRDVILPGEMKHHLYMVVKELINNSVKHSGCKHIVVNFSLLNNDLVIVVADDGNGFDKDQVRKDRNGIGNLRKRIADMNGDIAIDSVSGTKTTIRVPL